MNVIEKLRARRQALRDRLAALVESSENEDRALNEAESAEFDQITGEVRDLDARIEELLEGEAREAAAARQLVELGLTDKQSDDNRKASASVVNEPNPVYRKNDAHGPSFFKDMAALHLNDRSIAATSGGGTLGEVRRRLAASQETRANDMTSAAGAGGEFAPPLWLVEDFIKLARAGRVTADLLNKQVLPRGVSSINLPAVASGASTGVQQTQGTAVSDTAMTTTSVSTGISTIAGKQIVARQLIDQSGIPFDVVILGDLAADYAKQLDAQVLAGSGASGQLKGLDGGAGNTVTYTTTTPAVVSSTNANSFYFQLVSGINKIQTNRFMSPTAIVMHPRRWNWILVATDGQNRPLVVPSTPVFNGVAAFENGVAAEGEVGNLLGLPVYIDANVSTAANSTTNQDEVFILRTSDSWLYETEVESASFDATYADQASILFRVLGYAGLLHRYAKAISKVVGTGLVDPGL